MSNQQMKRKVRLTLIVVTVLTGLLIWQIIFGHAESIYGVWALSEDVDIQLRDDNSFAFYTKVSRIDQKSLTGSYSFDEEKNEIYFQRNDEAIFSWKDVSIRDNQLTFTQNGVRKTYFRAGAMVDREAQKAEGEAVVAVFSFNKQLAEKLAISFDLPTYWDGLSGFRNSHEGFERAVLYEVTEAGSPNPFITVENWSSTVAYESFAAVFNTEALRESSFVRYRTSPGVYQAIDQRGNVPATDEHVFVLLLVNVPDDLIETYMSQWKMLSDFMANQEGFQRAELYRHIQNSENHPEYFVRIAWSSEEHFEEVKNSEFYQSIVENPTYASRSNLYRIVSQDEQGAN